MTDYRKITSLFTQIEKWSEYYDFTFQFWGEGNNNVFIAKDSVDLASFGGEKTIASILERTMQWVKEKNPDGYKKPKEKKTYKKLHTCHGCGCEIAEGNDYCGECMCEDYSDY